MKNLIILITTLIAFQNLHSQISIQGQIDEPILIGCHWKPKINQTCLYKSASEKDYYFFKFTNAEFARIDDTRIVGFNASKEELELLYQAALDVYEKGNTLTLKVGEYDLMLVKEKWLSFHFSKKGEIDSYFMVNEKQLKKLFGK
ncbi:hypothetical protein BFP77_00095 [Maribacter sp. 4U21]|uniref:hypothetical protein n=1 Tax=Maribacter sp. 4U21 TaxID=1889779 RepID=UPI000C15AF36|nr:hypothetical protein [Maribacter sp. 4U21]PIB27599.1 hypothetical protein BFP77_00095 [Maribacter sp. 4U21]